MGKYVSLAAMVMMIVFGSVVMGVQSSRAGDLKGAWVSTGESWGAVTGGGQHIASTGEDRDPSGKIQWTLTIEKETAGKGFHGSWCSKNKCEDLLGVVRMDGSLLMADEDSTFFATRYQEKMELCVVEASPTFRVANCMMLQKK